MGSKQYSLQFTHYNSAAAFLLGEKGGYVCGAVNPAQPVNPVTCTGSALRPHGRKGGRGRDGSSQLPERMQPTALPLQCVHFFQ